MTRALGAAVVALFLIAPATARADGLPVPVDDAGPAGIVSADGRWRYITQPARENTIVQRIDTRGGRVAVSSWRHGRLGIPVVALDGTPAGLSHDGGTLVLIRPRVSFPRDETGLLILDADTLRTRRVLNLRGDFSFDAVSPDGSRVFLIEYTSRTDPTQYLVRSLDPTTGKLDPKPIVDPSEDPDEMRGFPLTREVSPDGRWHYTLYDGTGEHPFIHALDTTGPAAKCIDLPASLHNMDMGLLRLALGADGRTLTVTGAERRALVAVDTRTFAVGRPGQTPTRAAAPAEGDGGSALPELLTGLGLLMLGGLVAFAIRVRRTGGDPKAPRALP